MKQKIIIRDKNGKILNQGERIVRDLEHFNSQLKYKSHIQQSKRHPTRAQIKAQKNYE